MALHGFEGLQYRAILRDIETRETHTVMLESHTVKTLEIAYMVTNPVKFRGRKFIIIDFERDHITITPQVFITLRQVKP